MISYCVGQAKTREDRVQMGRLRALSKKMYF